MHEMFKEKVELTDDMFTEEVTTDATKNVSMTDGVDESPIPNVSFDPNQTYWTDYPFGELGDVAGQIAPIRPITVVRYDGDKYCDIIVKGIKSNIKAGYIYTHWGRCGDVPSICDVLK